MSNKLYISDDAPEILKETISVTQRMMDNMAEFKVKADNGTLTFADLDELTRRNNAISKELPPPPKPIPGYPVRTNNMEELEALSKARLQEAESLLKQQGGPVFKITSFDQLKKLSKMPPEALGEMVLKAAAEKRGETEEIKNEEPFIPPAEKQKMEFKSGIFRESFAEIVRLLFCAKLMYFDLHDDWTNAELFEKNLLEKLNIFKGLGQESKDRLIDILYRDEKDEDLAENQLEAALILVSLDWNQCAELQDLLAAWEKDGDLGPSIIKALKYSNNPLLPAKIEEILEAVSTEIRSGLIEVLEHRGAINEEKWTKLLERSEASVSHKIFKAFLSNNVPIDKKQLGKLIEDPESENFEASLLTNLLAGNKTALQQARTFWIENLDKVEHLPLYLTCAGNAQEFNLLKAGIAEDNTKLSAIRGVGMLGLPEGVPILVQQFPKTLLEKKQWDLCVELSNSLELITGANLPLSIPDIQQGPEGKEYEITVYVDFFDQWSLWWYQNHEQFQKEVRYRRGNPITLGSCIDEMAFGLGNYWSRQYSYYELQIRSGQHIAPFFADWDVEKQRESIAKWRQWWEENQNSFPISQWLFNGT